MTRERPPDRRATWRQKTRIGGQIFYVEFGEHSDGRLAEVFLTANKQGTLVRGILDALARTISVALQCGTPVAELVKALEGLRFPPDGPVEGSQEVKECCSLSDWIAQEMRSAYLGG